MRWRPTSSIFTIAATTPYTRIVIATATTSRMIARDTNGSSATSLRAITMISADRMKSVRIAPATIGPSCSGPNCSCGVSSGPWWPASFS